MRAKLSLAMALLTGAIGSVSIAAAADLPVRSPAPAPPPIVAPAAYDWSGFYIGGNVGNAQTAANFSSSIGNGTGFFDTGSLAFINAAGTGHASHDDITGGLQLGYNWQFGAWVPGIEGDFNALAGTAALTNGGVTPGGSTIGFTNAVKPDWISTVRGRLGYAFDPFLVYVTAGLAVLHADYNQSLTNITGGVPGFGSTSAQVTRAGWAGGGGLEYGIDRHWSARVEYLYAGFSGLSTSGTDIPGAGAASPLSGSARVSVQMTRAGIDYRF